MPNKINIDNNFKTNEIVNLDIDSLLDIQVNEKKSVTGVQKKLSLILKNNKKVTLANPNLEYIIKPNTKEFPYIAEAEFLNMQLANLVGIKTPPYNIVKLESKISAFIIRRMDRVNNKKIHMEDFAQLSNRGTEYKYESSCERCIKTIDKYSSIPELDKVEFIYRLLFCFLTLNSDMHLKNYSFIEDKYNTLSPAYDLLPVNLIYPSDVDEVALPLNGKKRNLIHKDFMTLSKYINNGEKVINNLINKLLSFKLDIITYINNSLLKEEDKKKYIDMFNNRCNRLIS